MLFSHNNHLYDIALKVERNNNSNYKNNFKNILINFMIKGSPVFSENAHLENAGSHINHFAE